MSRQPLDELKQQIPLLDYLEAHHWRPVRRLSRGRWMGLCPLHNDHKPSFLMDPSQNLFYCYGCGRGGDVIRFAELYHQVKFPQALALLHQWRGLAPLLHEAASFYHMQLHRHGEAIAYLHQRGVRSPEVIEHMRIGYARKWSRWLMLFLGVVALWSGAALLVERFVIDINGRAVLPTQAFLRSGVGRVLDIGAGTGRSSIMVLQSRPQATLVALDLFGESFQQHFGRGETPQQRLLANLKAAEVEQRATIGTADMRKLPFEPAAFDAIVSAYAIDHLNRQGTDQALAEGSCLSAG